MPLLRSCVWTSLRCAIIFTVDDANYIIFQGYHAFILVFL